ncbi:MAG: hypothetical protein Q8S09_06540 [Hyphomonas sp.]|nr:hypothetical protein [Hyphomonas sp.]
MTDQFERLMHRVCVDHGWCGAIHADGVDRHVHDYFPAEGIVTAGQFAEWAILADEEDPDSPMSIERGWRATLAAIFIECFGTDAVDARQLVYNDSEPPSV